MSDLNIGYADSCSNVTGSSQWQNPSFAAGSPDTDGAFNSLLGAKTSPLYFTFPVPEEIPDPMQWETIQFEISRTTYSRPISLVNIKVDTLAINQNFNWPAGNPVLATFDCVRPSGNPYNVRDWIEGGMPCTVAFSGQASGVQPSGTGLYIESNYLNILYT